jgi:hypothetical protein
MTKEYAMLIIAIDKEIKLCTAASTYYYLAGHAINLEDMFDQSFISLVQEAKVILDGGQVNVQSQN